MVLNKPLLFEVNQEFGKRIPEKNVKKIYKLLLYFMELKLDWIP